MQVPVGELVGRWIVDYKMDQDQGKEYRNFAPEVQNRLGIPY